MEMSLKSTMQASIQASVTIVLVSLSLFSGVAMARTLHVDHLQKGSNTSQSPSSNSLSEKTSDLPKLEDLRKTAPFKAILKVSAFGKKLNRLANLEERSLRGEKDLESARDQVLQLCEDIQRPIMEISHHFEESQPTWNTDIGVLTACQKVQSTDPNDKEASIKAIHELWNRSFSLYTPWVSKDTSVVVTDYVQEQENRMFLFAITRSSTFKPHSKAIKNSRIRETEFDEPESVGNQ